MSAPADGEDRRRFPDVPRWMDSWPWGLALPLVHIAPAGAVLGLVVCAVLRLGGWASGRTALLAGAVVFVSITVIGIVLARNADRRARAADRPGEVAPERLFPVAFVARGGWLAQFLDPAAAGYLVIEDEGIVLQCRRIRNHLLLLAFAFMALPVPEEYRAAGWCTGLLLWVVTAVLVRKERIAWSGILSVHSAGPRFHLEVAGESHRQGILLAVRAEDRDRLVEALRARTKLLEDEDATAPGSS